MGQGTRSVLLVLVFATGCDGVGLALPTCRGVEPVPAPESVDESGTETGGAAPIVLVLGHDGEVGSSFEGIEWLALYNAEEQAYLCGWDVPAWGEQSQSAYSCYDCAFAFDISAGGEVSVWAEEEDPFGVSYCQIYGIGDGDTASAYDSGGELFYRPIGFVPFYSYGSYVMTDVVMYYNLQYGWFPVGYGDYSGGEFSWYYVFWDYYYY